MTGWLLPQLPQVMGRDRVIAGFVRACEEVADSLRERVATVEHELDVDLASPEMLSYLAAWLGVELDTIVAADDDGSHSAEARDVAEARNAQRRLIRAVGQVLGWRGTARGLEMLLEALTGARAQVVDAGGVFGQHDPVPPSDDLVRVYLDSTGSLTHRQIFAFIADELPVGTRVEVRVRSQGKTGGTEG
jgi:phage tail-like protein